MKHETTAERLSDLEIVVRREFNAPARIVFKAWTQPDLFRRWWVPRSLGMKLLSCDMDVRVGGKYRLVFAHGEGGSMAFFGRYLEVVPDSRLVWTNEEGGEGGPITTVTLEEKNGRTFLALTERHSSKQSLDDNLGASEGLRETFGQLDELLGLEDLGSAP
jgi:uncharacterized protein YndB with AHSA1/START domain